MALQKDRQIAVTTPLGEDQLLFRRMRGSEKLGRLSEYHLELLSKNAQIALADVLGQRMTVSLKLPNGGGIAGMRYFDGFVSSFSHEGRRGSHQVYRAVLRPWLWFLTRTADCRIWQDMTAPEIVTGIFREHGFTDFEESLTRSYRKLPYCVQYRETDFNFVSRLMEQEGIYYYFKHFKGLHTLVLADSYSSHETYEGYAEIGYSPPGESVAQSFEHIHDWRIGQQVHSGAMALRSFNFEKPRANLEVGLALQHAHAHAEYELFDYPGPYTEAADGENYARTWLEALEAQHEQARGSGIARGLCVGSLFKLEGFPRSDQNKEQLVVASSFQLESNDYESSEDGKPTRHFECHFVAIDSRQPFRCARTTQKPVVQGPQTAIVVGKVGEEIWTDAHGRVKVQFHWDRLGKADENSSCWVRVAQVWAGKQWGGLYLPRRGQEVIVDFLEGDPDQPIITGRVYNGDAKPPYALPENATMSTLKSNSSKGGGGFNEIRFEDKKDAEQLFVHAQRDYELRAGRDRIEYTERDHHGIVNRDRIEETRGKQHQIVKGERVANVGGDEHLDVKGLQALRIGGSKSEKVGGAVAESYGSDHSEQVGGNYYLNAGTNVVIEAGVQLTLKVGGNFVTIGPAGVSIQGSLVMINSGGAAGSGSAGSLVAPLAALSALLAAKAEPGANTDIEPAGGEAPRHDPQSEENKDKTHWVEVELVDEAGQPVPGEAVRVTLPDGETVAEGCTNEKGVFRIANIDPGSVTIAFPNLDDQAWSE